MRCFVAVEPSPAVRDAVAVIQQALRIVAPAADVRWPPPVNVHLTLAFLGEIDEPTARAVAARLAHLAPAETAPPLVACGLGAFPDRRRPRVLWYGVVGDGVETLRRLHAAVRGADEEPFAPHLTIGRVRSPRDGAALREALRTTEVPAVSWSPAEVVIYRSHLRPTGSVYEPLARVPFAAA